MSLTSEAVNAAEQNRGSAKTEDELVELAKDELKKHIDLKYEVESEITKEGLIRVDLKEVFGTRKTGAGGCFVYMEDGQLFSYTVSKRLEHYDAEIITEADACISAREAVKRERTDLICDDNSKAEIELIAGKEVLVYKVMICAEGPSFTVFCDVSVNAETGEILELAYSDR